MLISFLFGLKRQNYRYAVIDYGLLREGAPLNTKADASGMCLMTLLMAFLDVVDTRVGSFMENTKTK